MSAFVKDVMSPHPISVTRDASFKELAARLFELGVSGFPGVVTVRDRLVYPVPMVVVPGRYITSGRWRR
jgi:predicted transcriptional regulator